MIHLQAFITRTLACTNPSWHPILTQALSTIDSTYLLSLANQNDWLPGSDKLLAAFSLPLTQTRFVLYGESPYPRSESANGYAFWDDAIEDLWSTQGLSRSVNRATSLRNFIKMLLVAEQALSVDTNAGAIAILDKQAYCQTVQELFSQFIRRGFLLLNASLSLSARSKTQEARLWLNFHDTVLSVLAQQKQPPSLLLLGKIADPIQSLAANNGLNMLIAEHPYNLSFIHNTEVLTFFKDQHLLLAKP